jgi:hypothetical protein
MICKASLNSNLSNYKINTLKDVEKFIMNMEYILPRAMLSMILLVILVIDARNAKLFIMNFYLKEADEM